MHQRWLSVRYRYYGVGTACRFLVCLFTLPFCLLRWDRRPTGGQEVLHLAASEGLCDSLRVQSNVDRAEEQRQYG